MRSIAAAGAVLLCLCGSTASAAITGTITADNHYALYSVLGGDLIFVGRNELGHDGDPGPYNWSLPETFQFETTGNLYIAAWSDGRVAQGLLAQFAIGDGDAALGGVNYLRTGDPGWQVYRTGVGKDDGSPAPSPAEVAVQVAYATANDLWEVPAVGSPNSASTQPWGLVPGIGGEARWTWADAGSGQDSFVPGRNAKEYLIFCTPIPSPGASAVLVGAGLLTAIRRGRR